MRRYIRIRTITAAEQIVRPERGQLSTYLVRRRLNTIAAPGPHNFPQGECQLVFEQRLSDLEAQLIKKTPNGKFFFNQLIVNVGSDIAIPKVNSQRLIIPDAGVLLDELVNVETDDAFRRLKKERDELRDQNRELAQNKPLQGLHTTLGFIDGLGNLRDEGNSLLKGLVIEKVLRSNDDKFDDWFNRAQIYLDNRSAASAIRFRSETVEYPYPLEASASTRTLANKLHTRSRRLDDFIKERSQIG